MPHLILRLIVPLAPPLPPPPLPPTPPVPAPPQPHHTARPDGRDAHHLEGAHTKAQQPVQGGIHLSLSQVNLTRRNKRLLEMLQQPVAAFPSMEALERVNISQEMEDSSLLPQRRRLPPLAAASHPLPPLTPRRRAVSLETF
ncbi:unnamed protein product [Meganyctiphanes norvegica]|uniref:Uncharacterized protein n=1 Tax=Meganyctiphanes norvegica TaxID=48144 RepID=A0AAV2S946_MEGNR